MSFPRLDRRNLFWTATAAAAGYGALADASCRTPMLELDQSENPWRNGLAPGAFPLRGGKVRVPTGPGLGIQVDEDVVRRYAV